MPESPDPPGRLAVIGLDAGDWRHLVRLVDAGHLPTIGRLRAQGHEVPLRAEGSIARVWETFLRPDVKAEDISRFDPATYATHWLGGVLGPPFFAADPAPRTVMLDVPYSCAAEAGDWLKLVNGWGVHIPGSGPASHPTGLLEEMTAAVGPNPTNFIPTAEWHDPGSVDRYGRNLAEGARRRGDAARWLLDRFPDWELAMIVFSELHSGAESMFQGIDPDHLLAATPTAELAGERLVQVHEAVDQAIGQIVDALPAGANVVLCSLHGAMPITEEPLGDVILPELLHRHYLGRPFLRNPVDGWLENGAAPVVPRVGWERREYLGRLARQPKRAPGLRRAARLAGHVRHRLRQRVRHRPEGRYVEDRSRTVPAWYRRRWPKMAAFAVPGYYFGRIRLNVVGREASGLVEPADYLRVRDEVEALVRGCRDARTGEPVVAEIKLIDSSDGSGVADSEADLLIRFSQAQVDAVIHPDLGLIGPYPLGRTSTHTPHGFALVVGPDIVPGLQDERSIVDLPEIILGLLGRASRAARSTTPGDGSG